jgi:hypothetical protein
LVQLLGWDHICRRLSVPLLPKIHPISLLLAECTVPPYTLLDCISSKHLKYFSKYILHTRRLTTPSLRSYCLWNRSTFNCAIFHLFLFLPLTSYQFEIHPCVTSGICCQGKLNCQVSCSLLEDEECSVAFTYYMW